MRIIKLSDEQRKEIDNLTKSEKFDIFKKLEKWFKWDRKLSWAKYETQKGILVIVDRIENER